jgi:exonuclease III
MKLISVNIECNKHDELVLNFLKKEKADVICIQELLEEELEYYKKELGLLGVYQPFDYCCSYINSKPNFNYYPELRGKRHGLAIFAKKIIKSGSVFYAGKKENILKSFEEYITDEKYIRNKALLWAEVKDDKGEIFKFITTQLPVTHEGEITAYQLEVINSMLSCLSDLGEFVFSGDMNAPRGHKSFDIIAEKYKDNIPQEYKTSIDQNLHRTKGIQFMVDGLFTTPTYNATNVKLVDGVSDHMAVTAEINKV